MGRWVVEVTGTAVTAVIVDAKTKEQAEEIAMKRANFNIYAYRPSKWKNEEHMDAKATR